MAAQPWADSQILLSSGIFGCDGTVEARVEVIPEGALTSEAMFFSLQMFLLSQAASTSLLLA